MSLASDMNEGAQPHGLSGQSPATPSASTLMATFRSHLAEVVAQERMWALLDTTEEAFDPDVFLDLLVSSNLDPARFVPSVTWEDVAARLEALPGVGHEAGRRLVVAPASPLFAPILARLARTFPNLVFVDLNQAGLAIEGQAIRRPDEVRREDGDTCLILTRNQEASDAYERQFGKANCINWLHAYVREQRQALAPGTAPFLAAVNAHPRPLLCVSAKPLATLNSTLRALQDGGYGTFWMGTEEVRHDHQTGYATPKVEDVPLTGHSIGGLVDLLGAFCALEHGLALYHYETLFPPAWDFRRAALCYAGTLALIRTVKACRPAHAHGRLGLFMYDAVKPGVKHHEDGAVCGRLYKAMVAEAEAVVFSSYTEDFGTFVENAIGHALPRVHHHRYQTMPKARRPRLRDGFHIAAISVVLEDFWEPSRMGLVPYIRDLLAQGLHFHYYVGGQEKAKQFAASLTPEQRSRFHLHAPIHDLDALSSELSQYHLGWSLFNMQVFDEIVAGLTDPFMRDAMDLFTPTTLPSVIWTCAAAGLPVLCNRSMRAVVDLLPPGMAIPLTVSELHRLPALLAAMDWGAIDRIPLDGLDIACHIPKLTRFLEGYYAEPRFSHA